MAAVIVPLVCQAVEPPPLRVAKRDVLYKPGDDITDYQRERCRLDLYLPEESGNAARRPVVVFFHGGGLTGGDKQTAAPIARLLNRNGVIVVAANYRFSPKVEFPAYVRDAADAVRWTHDHVDEYGGDSKLVFLSGHSAGGYLTLMAAAELGCFADDREPEIKLAGLLPISGQTLNHTAVRRERGIPEDRVVVDDAAPLNAIRASGPPTLLICGDRDLPLRLEQNELLLAHFKRLGDNRARLVVGVDRDHGSIYDLCHRPGDPVGRAIVEFIEQHAR
ncbi:Carboxylesterase NlhH [Posidoniimonas polymericola]|uniref:Carboxylesterase NlhH n=2 Tax=Posidoniimonas polymericola TaxID=2528002 RepID=A0A5C5YST6_9BACT|nr:Carboxylesterase NlhH [Posidoniimonas polymericola]